MRSLVTGGTGFIGANVVRALLRRGDEVRVLARPESDGANLRGLAVDVVHGDLGDRTSLRAAVASCDRVFHVGALYSFWVRDPDLIYEVNVEGTRNVLAAAEEGGVKRIVVTSSVAALAVPRKGEVVTEDVPADPSRILGAYKRSKYLAEQVALEAAGRGVPVVIVNPSFPVGPWDAKPTPTGRVVVDFLNRRMPAYIETGMNVVAVEDVAEGHLLAAERGRIGQRYILGGENMTMRRLLEILAGVSGLPAPRIRVPYGPILALSYANVAACRVTGRTPRMTPDTIRMSRHAMYYDSGKAQRELGLPSTPIAEALRRAVAWFTENGYVRPGIRTR
ncbi:MAG: NAD-dependent epimerase/dehydratase family protein [Candidatus Bipolaricaulis sp.]|nr:NAD-dependent epimerase/dehydratase family protein [Candidatus Bipolaricaulis sp.]MDD5645637.1 NAD-dependent epimerase/dehydratase family protein [Candidatus Bipolaricaulis sp.]